VTELGFSREQAKEALELFQNNVESAINFLLGN